MNRETTRMKNQRYSATRGPVFFSIKVIAAMMGGRNTSPSATCSNWQLVPTKDTSLAWLQVLLPLEQCMRKGAMISYFMSRWSRGDTHGLNEDQQCWQCCKYSMRVLWMQTAAEIIRASLPL